RVHRGGWSLSVRQRHLRDPGRVPTRPAQRGRVPDPGHGGQHGGRDRAIARGARPPRQPLRPPAGPNERAGGMTLPALPAGARNRAWIYYLVAGSGLTALYLFAPHIAGNGPLINALGLSGVLAIVAGIRMHRPGARAAWWLFAAGQFLYFGGYLYTYGYRKVFGADVPFPSAGDALYL